MGPISRDYGSIIFFNMVIVTDLPMFRSLAVDDGFSDLPGKLILLNFAVTHCPPEEITHILKERQILEMQVCNYQKLYHILVFVLT